ncbi:hypothetical protein MHU86_5649 (chloroplast) [Fragilaria crotonensis]|nr:hypothetical protein MHU86_5649 [Fragilaria crotonensis]
MDWNEIQNSSSNLVFAILLIAMISYWVNLSFLIKVIFYQILVNYRPQLQVVYCFSCFVQDGLLQVIFH